MRYLVRVVCVLAMSLASVASPSYAQEPKLSLTLRTSYFYDVDVDPVSAQPEPKQAEQPPSSSSESTSEEPPWMLPVQYYQGPTPEPTRGRPFSRGAKAGIAIGAIVVAGGLSVGIAAAVFVANFDP